VFLSWKQPKLQPYIAVSCIFSRTHYSIKICSSKSISDFSTNFSKPLYDLDNWFNFLNVFSCSRVFLILNFNSLNPIQYCKCLTNQNNFFLSFSFQVVLSHKPELQSDVSVSWNKLLSLTFIYEFALYSPNFRFFIFTSRKLKWTFVF
jgi:hypothetical protein